MPYDAYRWFAAHTAASILAVTILTYFHIVLGEMVPKSLALQAANNTVLMCRRSSSPCRWRSCRRDRAERGGQRAAVAAGGDPAGHAGEHYHTTEELQFIIRESQEGGMLRGDLARMLRELFEFGSLTAGEVMVPRVRLVGIPAGTPGTSCARSSAATRTPATPSTKGASTTSWAGCTSRCCCGTWWRTGR